MNRIVREHYPVSRLPEDLRESFGDIDFVTVTLDASEDAQVTEVAPEQLQLPEPEPSRGETLGGQFSRFKHVRRSNYRSVDEVNDYVNSLRDEWADRER